jgi:Putative porin
MPLPFTRSILCVAAALALAVTVSAPHAAEPGGAEQVRASLVKLIEQLVAQGVLTRDRADALPREAATPPPAAAPAAPPTAPAAPVAPGTVRVPLVPEFIRKELKEELRKELREDAVREGWAGPGAVPEWVRGLKWDGDLRVRYQFDNFAKDNAPAISIGDTNRNRALSLLNTTEDRQRLRVRARLGLTTNADENWSSGVRLTTGSTTDPVSSNQTLGTYGNRFTVAFDRAYLRFRGGDQFNAVAGRFGNPWLGTELLWANDLGFDGIATQWTPRLGPETRGVFSLAGIVLQELELSKYDKGMVGVQLGVETSRLVGHSQLKFGLGYYHYGRITGQVSAAGSTLNEFTAPAFTQKGNTYYNISSDPNRPLLGLAARYRLLNATAVLSVPMGPGKAVTLTGDVVNNIGFDRAAVSARVGTDVEPKTRGFMARLAVGDTEVAKAGQWQAFAGYKRVERDAVLDAFTDSDFRLGGTDAKGYTVGGSYGLGRHTAASLRVMSADAISGAPLSIDVIQFDVQLRF